MRRWYAGQPLPSHPQPLLIPPAPLSPATSYADRALTDLGSGPGLETPRLALRPFQALSLVCAEGLGGHRSCPFWGIEDFKFRFRRRNAVVEGKAKCDARGRLWG